MTRSTALVYIVTLMALGMAVMPAPRYVVAVPDRQIGIAQDSPSINLAGRTWIVSTGSSPVCITTTTTTR